jgi:hypothetical protein
MAEKSYIGYKATPGIDWGKLTSEFSQGLLGIGERRAAQNIYFDNLYKENMDAVKEVERSNDQDLNTIIQGAMSQVKDNAFDMNNLVKSGSMNHNEYRNFVNNTNNSITSFAKTAKGLDATIQENIKRQQLDENGKPQGSEYEEYLTESYSKLLDLRNKTMYQDPQTGKMFLATLGPDGLADMNTIQDASALNKPMNIRDNYVDYNQVINNKIKTFGEIKIEERLPDGSTITRSGISKIVDVKDKDGKVIGQRQALNKNVADGIATTQNEITSNPRSTYNILKMMDDRFDSYQDDEEYRSKMSRLIDIENQSRVNQGQTAMNESETERYVSEADMFMIPSSPDSKSELQPQPSADQVQMAKDWIKDTFYMQMDYTETLKAAPKKGKGGGNGGGGGGGKGDGVNFDLYEKLHKAITEGDSEALNIQKTPEAKELRFEVNDRGLIDVYDISENIVGKPKNELMMSDKTLTDLVPYFYGKSGATGGTKPEEKYNAERDAFYKANPNAQVIAMNEGQPEGMAEDQMASLPQQEGNFMERLFRRGSERVNRFLGNEQNIS